MPEKFHELTATRAVRAAREHYHGQRGPARVASAPDTLGEDETAFIRERDSFYLATVSETGWPYLQHRGGAPGFLRVVGNASLAFADYPGNRQLLSTGNIAAHQAGLGAIESPHGSYDLAIPSGTLEQPCEVAHAQHAVKYVLARWNAKPGARDKSHDDHDSGDSHARRKEKRPGCDEQRISRVAWPHVIVEPAIDQQSGHAQHPDPVCARCRPFAPVLWRTKHFHARSCSW